MLKSLPYKVIGLHYQIFLSFTFRSWDGIKKLQPDWICLTTSENKCLLSWALWHGPVTCQRVEVPTPCRVTRCRRDHNTGLYLVISDHVSNQQISTWTTIYNSNLMWSVYFMFWLLKLDCFLFAEGMSSFSSLCNHFTNSGEAPALFNISVRFRLP